VNSEVYKETGEWSTSFKVQEEILSIGKQLLEAKPQKDDFDSYRLARDFYRSCIDEERREEVGLRPLVQILQDLGGWPILEGDCAHIV
jgi:hypothetical protein